MDSNSRTQHTLFNVGKQQVSVDFEGGRITSDAGLLVLRAFEQELGILKEVSLLLPDPRDQRLVDHSADKILVQAVYRYLAGYPDGNDANPLRDDPLFRVLSGIDPESTKETLPSTSTVNRFAHAFTRRMCHLPAKDSPILLEVRRAQLDRIHLLTDYLPQLFIRTRRQRPSYIILDLDATDDPVHGDQQLGAYHAYYRQHQFLPLHIMDGETGFPLAVALRPGNAHASWGAVDMLRPLVHRLRQAWPGITILVRADNGLAVPEMYEYCEREGLLYAFGYSTNAVLKRRTAKPFADLKLYYTFCKGYLPNVRRFVLLDDYQAEGWSRSRRIVAKLELMPEGTNRRFIVTNLSGDAQGIYEGFYVKRGAVPEQPIGELKNGLAADRLSSPRFLANCFKLLIHTLAYAIVVLFREATAAIPEVGQAHVGTLRARFWKIGAVVRSTARQIRFHLASGWPFQHLFGKIIQETNEFVTQLRGSPNATVSTPPL